MNLTINVINISVWGGRHISWQLGDASEQHSDHVTKAFNYHWSPSSYLIHSLAFSFIIKPSSIILLIYTLSQACAGAINIGMEVFFVCVCVQMWKRNLMCLCASSCVAAIKIKAGILCVYLSVCERMWGVPGANQFIIFINDVELSEEFSSHTHTLFFFFLLSLTQT